MSKRLYSYKYDLGEEVYLRTDPDQRKRIITGWLINMNNTITYRLACGIEDSYHFENEIAEKETSNSVGKDNITHQKEIRKENTNSPVRRYTRKVILTALEEEKIVNFDEMRKLYTAIKKACLFSMDAQYTTDHAKHLVELVLKDLLTYIDQFEIVFMDWKEKDEKNK